MWFHKKKKTIKIVTPQRIRKRYIGKSAEREGETLAKSIGKKG